MAWIITAIVLMVLPLVWIFLRNVCIFIFHKTYKCFQKPWKWVFLGFFSGTIILVIGILEMLGKI